MAVFMGMISVWLNIDEKRLVPALQEAGERLDSSKGEALLDFSSVCRIDSSALRVMEEFVGLANDKGVKVVLCGVSVGVYKVLKLAKVASRFSFVSRDGSGKTERPISRP
jgi:anti-anti-sigma regulatory factor